MSGLIPNTYAPPQWLDQEFLQAALRKGLRRDSINVSSCTIKPATNVGDNYLSQMFRASARVTSHRKGSEQLSIVIKSMPQGELVEKFVNDSKFFATETLMLAETLPLLQSTLDEAGGQRLSAHLFFKQDAPNNSLVLEDLRESGFAPVNRLDGLDLDHSVLVVEHLAIFHAASVAAIRKHPHIKETYALGFWQRHNEEYVEKYLTKGLNMIAECVKIWKNFPTEVVQKLEKLEATSMEKLFLSTDLNEDELNVLNHGDPWTSNIMFKYTDGLPTDLRFVDFQLSFYNSPVYDLIYFIFSSPQKNIQVRHLNELLEKYHVKLTQTCQSLNYPLDFTLDDLRKVFFKRLFLGFFMAIVLVPFMMAESGDVPDLNDYLKEENENLDEYIQATANNAKYRETMEVLLPFFDEHGVLD